MAPSKPVPAAGSSPSPAADRAPTGTPTPLTDGLEGLPPPPPLPPVPDTPGDTGPSSPPATAEELAKAKVIAEFVMRLSALKEAGFALDAVFESIQEILAKAEADPNPWSERKIFAYVLPIVTSRFTPAVRASLFEAIATQLLVAVRLRKTGVRHQDADFMGA